MKKLPLGQQRCVHRQGSPGRQRPRRPGSLKPWFPSLESSGAGVVSKLRGYKAGLSGRKLGIWKSPDGKDGDVLWRPIQR